MAPFAMRARSRNTLLCPLLAPAGVWAGVPLLVARPPIRFSARDPRSCITAEVFSPEMTSQRVAAPNPVSIGILRILVGLLIACLLVPLALFSHTPAYALRDPCALDPNNLVRNGSMGPEHGTQYGSVANEWNPFIFAGNPPQFRWVGNEQIDPNGSQQLFSSSTFDAGVQQTVTNLQPGVYYWVRWGYSLAAKSYSGPNVRVDSIGRKIGVDPTGGTDPHSPNVLWGPDYFNGVAALNIPEMKLTFAARSDKATVYLRAMARDGSSGENRVWMDAICMEAIRDMATATPLAPTATPVPPTATPRPTQPPTKVAVRPPSSPTATKPPETPTPENSPTPTATATPIGTATPSPTARFARPIATPAPSALAVLNSGLFTGLGLSSVFGSLVFFAFGIILSRRPS